MLIVQTKILAVNHTLRCSDQNIFTKAVKQSAGRVKIVLYLYPIKDLFIIRLVLNNEFFQLLIQLFRREFFLWKCFWGTGTVRLCELQLLQHHMWWWELVKCTFLGWITPDWSMKLHLILLPGIFQLFSYHYNNINFPCSKVRKHLQTHGTPLSRKHNE